MGGKNRLKTGSKTNCIKLKNQIVLNNPVGIFTQMFNYTLYPKCAITPLIEWQQHKPKHGKKL